VNTQLAAVARSRLEQGDVSDAGLSACGAEDATSTGLAQVRQTGNTRLERNRNALPDEWAGEGAAPSEVLDFASPRVDAPRTVIVAYELIEVATGREDDCGTALSAGIHT
jgi:hypothetical protein